MTGSPKFLRVSAGARVRSGASVFEIEGATTAETVIAKNIDTGAYATLDVAALQPETDAGAGAMPHLDLVANAADFATAQLRLDAIMPLLKNPGRTRADVREVAKAAKKSVATVYSWMRMYEDSPQISSLVPEPPGPDKGSALLDPKREEIINFAINQNLRVPQRKRVAKVIKAVEGMCSVAGVTAPHANTVRLRVKALQPAALLRSQGRHDEARDKYDPVLAAFPGANSPLAVVQMDHGIANVQIVDDGLRLALGRPWITVAMDVYSRMIVGLVVSLEHPSSSAAGRCVANAMLPKADYLTSLGVPGAWKAWGAPAIVHMDNAKEFRGELLKTSFAEYNIELKLRKVKTPHYGGHIERMMLTFAHALRDLPGATFSNPEERKGYNSEGRAAMTLAEFEAWLVDYVVNIYHKEFHSGIDTTPEAKWNEGILGTEDTPGVGIPEPPADPERLKLDFLPFKFRTIGRRGIRLDHIDFWNERFRFRVNEADPDHRKQKRKFLTRVPPEDITRIWFWDPDDKQYVLTPTLDITRPAVSRWEWNAVKRKHQQDGKKVVDEQGLFDTRARLLKRADEASAKTKSARRAQQRAAASSKHAANTTEKIIPRFRPEAEAKRPAAPPVAQTPKAAIRPEDILPFDDIDAE